MYQDRTSVTIIIAIITQGENGICQKVVVFQTLQLQLVALDIFPYKIITTLEIKLMWPKEYYEIHCCGSNSQGFPVKPDCLPIL